MIHYLTKILVYFSWNDNVTTTIETPDITSFTVTMHTACNFKWDLQIKLNSFVLHKYKAIKSGYFNPLAFHSFLNCQEQNIQHCTFQCMCVHLWYWLNSPRTIWTTSRTWYFPDLKILLYFWFAYKHKFKQPNHV